MGPVDVTEKGSPKRLSRSMTVKQQKTPRDSASSPPSSAVPRPRPCEYFERTLLLTDVSRILPNVSYVCHITN